MAEYLIDRYAKRKRITKISKQALDLLQVYYWPGNIRELQNVIERAVILCDGETFVVDETWFAFAPISPKAAVPAVAMFENLVQQERDLIENALRRLVEGFRDQPAHQPNLAFRGKPSNPK